MTDFNPMDIADSEVFAFVEIDKTHNQDPTEVALQAIADLFDEAKNWADGEAITSEAMHDAITDLRSQLHEAGKVAEALRVEAKKPHDDAIAVIQSRFNPFVQKDKGKVDMGKKALDDLLGKWRIAKQQAAAAEARRVADAAEAARQAANAAMQSSSGNLAAREEAEQRLAEAKALEKTAKKADKAATTGTGLVTRWVAVLDDEEQAMDWTWGRAKDELLAVAQRNADEVVRAGVRSVPGFRVEERKEAR
ncbi:MAG: hypothetical protein H5U22_06560 [Rhizobium sp.]|nr:hypothetical protein [Rhizobium sp.]